MRYLPVVFAWRDVDLVDADGEVTRSKAMVPLRRYGNVCARQFHEGEEYPLAPIEARSRSSHNHYFAALNEGFQNLPEDIAEAFPSTEHLRKWLLVRTKWCDERQFDCPDEQFALRLGAFIRTENEFAIMSYHRIGDGFKLVVRNAKSQSAAAMGKEDFEASKRDVLDELCAIISVKLSDLHKQAGRIPRQARAQPRIERPQFRIIDGSKGGE